MTDQEAAVWAAVYTMRLKKLHARAGRTQESWGEDRVQARIAATWAVYGFREAAEEIAAADLARPDQTQADDRSNRQLATLNAVVRELLSERDNAGYVPDGLCVAIGWPDPIMLVNLSTKAKP